MTLWFSEAERRKTIGGDDDGKKGYKRMEKNGKICKKERKDDEKKENDKGNDKGKKGRK